jgi:hypothetical protein
MAFQAAAQMGQGGNRGGENRKRNTSTNLASKQSFPGTSAKGISGGGLPTLDPSATANYYSQLQTLQTQLSTQLAALRQQRVGFRGESQVARADIRAQGVAAMSENVNASLERGMLGSSSDLAGRASVRAAVSSGITDVNRQLFQQLADSRIAAQQSALGYEQGVQQVESAAIAQRMQLAAQQQQNQLQIQLAQMQAEAQDVANAAQLQMSQKQLRIARQQAQALQALANQGMTVPGQRTGGGAGGSQVPAGLQQVGLPGNPNKKLTPNLYGLGYGR